MTVAEVSLLLSLTLESLTMDSFNVVWLISYSKTHLAQALVYPYSTTLQSALSSSYFGHVVHVVQQAINRLYM